ncbi:lysis protein [Klebsiella sp. Acro-834]|nr:lysis protein [Klebsiella sp. Acro-834]NIG40933.1 lysis protein [Klebsiella sp. Acro-833]HCB9205886.1 lysis protein [Klebsiella variicola]HDK6447333.1 lysis protein [Klebsiella variicola]
MWNIRHLSAIITTSLLGQRGERFTLRRNFTGKHKRQRDTATEQLHLTSATITDMQTRQRDVAALDTKYTGELADAKATIDQLERDITSGKRRLQLNARCPSNGTTGTGGMGDAPGPRLNDSAERDYFTIRERILTVTKLVDYLQKYVQTQCLR